MPKDALRQSHIGITLNDRSAPMEQRVRTALVVLREDIETTYGVKVEYQKRLFLDTVVSSLNEVFGAAAGMVFEKATSKPNTYISPDGGFLYVQDEEDVNRYILVVEAKRQGTNTDRAAEGKPKQAQGNAIERLRKNMQGIDCLFAPEAITPFVCFGEGCDFEDGSTILDRVSTMNSFFPLNTIYVDKIYVAHPQHEIFKPTSLFFREDPWSPQEMKRVMWAVCQRSMEYYHSKYKLQSRG